jgi:hypothetical protein
VTLLRRTVRRVCVVALVAPLSGAGLLLAGPAYAASGITAPGSGVEFTSDTTVRITASLDKNSGSADLRLKSPTAGSAETVDSAASSLTSGASLAYNFDTATCASFPGSCSGRAEAPNGVWTVSLVGGGKTLDSSTFTLSIPPRAPTGLAARADGYRAVVLSWTKGVEPDLTGWTLYADGAASAGAIGTDACSGGSCSTTVTYAQDGTGQHTYSLVAHRSAAPGSSATLDSPQSSQASASLDAPPPPPPASPAPASGGSGSGSGSGSGTSASGSAGSSSSAAPTSGGSSSSGAGSGSRGGSSGTSGGSSGHTSSSAIGTSPGAVTVASRRAFALSFQTFSPKLGIPKLPPLPAAAPALAPLPDGTYEKTLGYKDVVQRQRIQTPQATARRLTGSVGSALDSAQFLRSLAGALVLLLVAAHLRRWLGSGHRD